MSAGFLSKLEESDRVHVQQSKIQTDMFNQNSMDKKFQTFIHIDYGKSDGGVADKTAADLNSENKKIGVDKRETSHKKMDTLIKKLWNRKSKICTSNEKKNAESIVSGINDKHSEESKSGMKHFGDPEDAVKSTSLVISDVGRNVDIQNLSKNACQQELINAKTCLVKQNSEISNQILADKIVNKIAPLEVIQKIIENEIKEGNEKIEDESNLSKQSTNIFECTICQSTFQNGGGLKSHMWTHGMVKPLECEICNKTFTNIKGLRQHSKIHSGENLRVCDVCGKAFLTRQELKFHKLTHNNEKPFSCDVCGKSFTRKFGLTKHTRTHTGDKPYKCDLCKKSFTQAGSLRLHQQRHLGEKPFKCDICGMGFIRPDPLKNHYRTHTDERPHTCSICQKGFRQRSTLVSHELSHTTMRNHECDICGKAFVHRKVLVVHLKTHRKLKPHVCSICGKSYINRQLLTRHERTHSGEKPFACKNCDKCFSMSEDLVRHLKIHSSNKPFICDVCGKDFRHNSHLTSHMKTHNDKPSSDMTLTNNSNTSVASFEIKFEQTLKSQV